MGKEQKAKVKVKKKGILRKQYKYVNKFNPDGEKEREAFEYFFYLSSKYIPFQRLRNHGKTLELYYVTSWKLAYYRRDKEALDKYIMKIFFGHFSFAAKIINIIYKEKRIDDTKTKYDMVIDAFYAFRYALRRYTIFNEWKARFLAYLEKNMQGHVMRQSQHKSIFHDNESYINYILSKKNEPDSIDFFGETYEASSDLPNIDLAYEQFSEEKEDEERYLANRDASGDIDMKIVADSIINFKKRKFNKMRIDILKALVAADKLKEIVEHNLKEAYNGKSED